MANIFSLFGEVLIDNQKANTSIDTTTEKAEKSSSKIGSAFSSIAKGAAAMGAAVVTGTVTIGTALIASAESTREYRTEMAKLETAFTASGLSAEAAEGTYTSLYSVLGKTDQAVEASNHLAKLCATEEQLASWTDICTGVYATFGSSLPIESLTEAANETAKVGALTGTLADALNWSGVSEDEFNAKLAACSTEQERAQLITETLTGLYSEAADTYRELSSDILSANEAQAKLTASTAKIGAAVEPVIATVKGAFADMVLSIMPVAETFVNGLIPPLMQLVEELFPILVNLIMALIPQIETLLPPIMQIIESVLPVVLELLEKLLPPALQIVESVLPIVITLLENLMPVIEPILDILLELLDPLLELLDFILPPLIDLIEFITEKLLPPLEKAFAFVAETIGTQFKGALEGIRQVFDNVKGVFNGLIDFVKNVFTGNWKGAWKSVIDIFSNYFEGIKNAFKVPINWIIDGMNSFIRGLNKLKIPDWVPLVGGKGFNISEFKRLRIGMEYVPYDEYPALLHKGERVLTAGENKDYSDSNRVPTVKASDEDGRLVIKIEFGEKSIYIENLKGDNVQDVNSFVDMLLELIFEAIKRKGVVFA